MYLNVIQVSESLGAPESEVVNWVREEGLPAIEDRGRLLFDRAQVADWAAARGLGARAGFLAASAGRTSGVSLGRLLRIGGVWREVASGEVISILARVLERLPGATPAARQLLTKRLHSPTGLTWTPLSRGVCLPHFRERIALGGDAGLLAALLLTEPLTLAEPPADGTPATRLLFFIAPTPQAHLEILAQLSFALSRGPFRQALMEGAADEALLAALEAPAVSQRGEA